MICEPACHSGSTMIVSVKLPLLSAWIIVLLPVSTTGIAESCVRPTRPRGVKLVPRTVMIAPRATLEGVTCNANSLCRGGVCAKMPRPRVTTTPKRPPPTIATSSTILTQKNKAGGARRGFLCDVCVSRYSDGKGRGPDVRGVDTGIRGKEGVRIGRESTILCQFLLR